MYIVVNHKPIHNEENNFFFSDVLLTTTTMAQVAMSRILTIKEGKQPKFMELAAKKTKKFNGKKGQPAYYTFSKLFSTSSMCKRSAVIMIK